MLINVSKVPSLKKGEKHCSSQKYASGPDDPLKRSLTLVVLVHHNLFLFHVKMQLF